MDARKVWRVKGRLKYRTASGLSSGRDLPEALVVAPDLEAAIALYRAELGDTPGGRDVTVPIEAVALVPNVLVIGAGS